MSKYVKAEQGLKNSVIYTDATGKHFRFSSGTWAWRNNNPGNLHPGEVSKRNNQIGVAGKFAVFPDYETGHEALLDCLKTTYADSSIEKLVNGYAPEGENNVAAYIKFLRKRTGIQDDTKIEDFTPEQFEKLWKAIEQMEGYESGVVVEVFQIYQAYREKGAISNYQVSAQWMSKEECLALADAGKMDVEVCTSRMGNPYLRARPDSSFQKKLGSLIIKKPKEQTDVLY